MIHIFVRLLLYLLILITLESVMVFFNEFKKSVAEINGDKSEDISRETSTAYNLGVNMGIINKKIYTFEAFKKDEENFLKELYKSYNVLNRTWTYLEWLVMNRFGILSDTHESLLQVKSMNYVVKNKRVFIQTVQMGDILLSARGTGGFIGHAAIMSSNNKVLEMPGGYGWPKGIKNNIRQISKDKWFDEHASGWITVYRCPDSLVAKQAAMWAENVYYNPFGGTEKIIHITYMITPEILKMNPSYCSKLVIQAYYFGTNKNVIKDLTTFTKVIVPVTIPLYFMDPYELINKGKF